MTTYCKVNHYILANYKEAHYYSPHGWVTNKKNAHKFKTIQSIKAQHKIESLSLRYLEMLVNGVW